MELEEAIKRFNEIKEEYNRFDGLTEYVEAMDFILNHLTKQEKMIDLMGEELAFGVFDFKSKEQVKQYFEKKAKEEK